MNNIEKELSFLFLATAFTNMYSKESKIKDIKIVNDLLQELGKKSRLFLSKAKRVTDQSIKVFEQCEVELRKQSQKRFGKKAVADEEGNYNAHGLLFAVALILEHQELKNRKVFLPYKIAKDIYKDFDGINNVNVENSRILAKHYADKVAVLWLKQCSFYFH